MITAGGAFIIAVAGRELRVCMFTVCQRHVCLTHPRAILEPLVL